MSAGKLQRILCYAVYPWHSGECIVVKETLESLYAEKYCCDFIHLGSLKIHLHWMISAHFGHFMDFEMVAYLIYDIISYDISSLKYCNTAFFI